MNTNMKTSEIVRATIAASADKYRKPECANMVTDFHFLVNKPDGRFIIMNDEDEVLSESVIEEWAATDDDGDRMPAIEDALKREIGEIEKEKIFESLSIFKPFSLLLEDENRETVSELLVIDEDNVMVSDELLKGLDDELEDFLRELLKY